jgi:hypothetical protein
MKLQKTVVVDKTTWIFAGSSFIQSVPESATLAPWTGLLVLIAWVVVAMALAIWRLLRSDA